MDADKKEIWKFYLASLQLDVAVADYTKVPITWSDANYTPDFNKLYYIVEGEGFIKVGNRTYYPKPGDLCLLPAGSVQSYGTVSEDRYGKYWCHFTAKLSSFHLFDLLETPIIVSLSDPAAITEKFERLIASYRSGEWTSGMHMHAAMLEIIAMYIEQADTVTISSATTGSFEKLNVVLKYIEEHLSENLTVDKLAQMVHFHPNYFIRMFKNTTGLSPIQYVNRKRVDKARDLLAFSSNSMSAIAEMLGMDATYFSRLFKDYTGLSPTEYREISLK